MHINPIFTVITVCYNSEKTIKKCLDSVSSQSFNDYEHIVIDGASSDSTLDILETYCSSNMKFFSRSDDGIYDAMNNGIARARGKYIAILNSDDFFAHEFVLQSVFNCFEEFSADVVYSGISFIGNLDQKIADWHPPIFSKGMYEKGFHTPHPGFFCTRSLYERLGVFDLNMDIAADFDLMLRFMEDDITKCVCLRNTTVFMRADGASSSLRNIIRGYNDIRISFLKNGIRIRPFIYFSKRYIPKLKRKLTSMF